MNRSGAFDMKGLALISLFSLAGGFLNGFIGAGGGVIMMLAMLCMRRAGGEKNAEFAGTAAAVMAFSIVSSIVYWATGRVDWELVPSMLLPAVLGGALGGALLRRIDPTLLRFVFSFLVLYSGVSMLM